MRWIHYWEKVVENILGGAIIFTSDESVATMSTVKEVANTEAKVAGAKKKSRLSKKKIVDEVQETQEKESEEFPC